MIKKTQRPVKHKKNLKTYLPAEFLQKLCASVCMYAVLKAKSGQTKYGFHLNFSFVNSLHIVH